MKVEFNLELLNKITKLQRLYVDLISMNIIQFKEGMNRDDQMDKWVYENFDKDISSYISKINEVRKKYNWPEYTC